MFSRLQEGFDEGRLERRTFLPKKWRAWVRLSKIDLGGHCGFTCLQFFFRKYDGFWLSAFAHTKMKAGRSTVVMYRSQQHGRRGQRIVTRKPESGIVWGN